MLEQLQIFVNAIVRKREALDSDCYDFEYRTKEDAPDFYNRVVNNEVGYALQENGYGVNYQIEVPFVFYIPIE